MSNKEIRFLTLAEEKITVEQYAESLSIRIEAVTDYGSHADAIAHMSLFEATQLANAILALTKAETNE